MKINICVTILLALAISVMGCQKDAGNPAGPSVIATEEWQFIMDNDTASLAQMTYQKKSDGSVVAVSATWRSANDGNALYGQCEEGIVTISDTIISIASQGTAILSGAPEGYRNSPFTLTIDGSARNGLAAGNWTVNFSAIGWPPSKSGTFTATRSSGSGITQ